MLLDPLDYLTDTERQILRNAIIDTGRGIYASPLIGGSHENVGRYMAEGGNLLRSHDWRAVWQAVVQLIGREPELLDGPVYTVAQVDELRRIRTERADALLDEALVEYKAGAWDAALDLIERAELAAPTYRPSHRTYADLRRFVWAERVAKADERARRTVLTGPVSLVKTDQTEAWRWIHTHQIEAAEFADVATAPAPGRDRVTTLYRAVADMAAGLLSVDPMTGGMDLYQRFSCTEIDPLLRVLVLAGHRDAAAEVLACHTAGDEPGDLHDHLLHDGDQWPLPAALAERHTHYVGALA